MEHRAFVLVHDAWHGGWSFYKVAALLREQGHTVISPDLPGHGTNHSFDGSLWGYTQHICRVLDTLPLPAILLGHSMGGAIISQVAEQRPARIKHLVYLSAMLLQNGESAFQLASGNFRSPLSQAIVLDEENGRLTIPIEHAAEIFYHDCSEADVALAQQLLVPEPLRALYTPLQITDERFGSIPRSYIRCEQDRILPPSLQERLYSTLPCQKILSLDSSHSPFFSQPEALAELLLSFA